MDSPLLFSRWLKRLRDELDITQELLAEQVSCSVETIRSFETGRRRPSRAMTERLADVLRVAPVERAEFLRLGRASGEQPSQQADNRHQLVPTAPPDPPLATTPRRARLPIPPTALIGREVEEAEVCRRLLDPACRLLTLVGAGGTGKTRLALQVATDLSEQFKEGAAFVALAPIMAAEHVAAAIADVLDCPLMPGQTPEESLLLWLRDRELLLVLDNLEHLLQATPLLTAILREAPGVRVLATSRERLRLQGEAIFELGGLAIPRDDTHDEIERCDAVLLFLERARHVAGDFALTPANRVAVGQICRLLDGMPLGVELAAAWVRTLTPEEVAAELERALDLPATAWRDLPARHRSLRAVFDHSWHLLTADEQRLLCRLAVFRGGFVREAAKEVADATLPLLAALTDKSLLRRPQAGRYELHPLIRRFAAEQLGAQPGWAEETAERHAAYYAQWQHRREHSVTVAASADTVVAEIRAEIDNLWLAWDWMIAHHHAPYLQQATACFAFFLEMRCSFREGSALFERAAAALGTPVGTKDGPPPPAEPLAYGQILGYAGWFAARGGSNERGRELLQQSLEVLRAQANQPALFHPLFGLGALLLAMGDYAGARQMLSESQAVARAMQDDHGVAYSLTLLGQVAHVQGQLDEARDMLREALGMWRAFEGGAAPCLNRLGAVLLDLGEYAEAEALLSESVEIGSNRDDPEGKAAALVLLGKGAALQGRLDEALDLLRECIAIFRELGTHERLAKALVSLGEAYGQAHRKAAQDAFVEALQIAHGRGFLPIVCNALGGLARLAVQEEALEQALGLLLHILEHPSTEHGTRTQAEQLRSDIEGRLRPAQVDVIRKTVRKEPFEVAVDEVLSYRLC